MYIHFSKKCLTSTTEKLLFDSHIFHTNDKISWTWKSLNTSYKVPNFSTGAIHTEHIFPFHCFPLFFFLCKYTRWTSLTAVLALNGCCHWSGFVLSVWWELAFEISSKFKKNSLTCAFFFFIPPTSHVFNSKNMLCVSAVKEVW